METPAGAAAAAAAPATERPKRGSRRREGDAGPRAAKRSAPAPAQEAAPPPAVAPRAAPAAQPGSPGMPAINPAVLSFMMMQQQVMLQQQAQQAQQAQQQAQQQQQLGAWPGLGGPGAPALQPGAVVRPGGSPQLQQWHGILPIIDMSQLAQRHQQQLAAAAAAAVPAPVAAPAAPLQPPPPGAPPVFSTAAYLQSLQSPQYQETYHQELAALNQQGQGLGQGQPGGTSSRQISGGGNAADATAAAAAAAEPSSGAGQPAPPDYGSAPTSPSVGMHAWAAAGQKFDQQFDQQFDHAAPLVEQARQVAQQAWQAQGATQQAQHGQIAQQAEQHFAAGGNGGGTAEGAATAGVPPHMPAATLEAAPPEAAPAQAEPPLGDLQVSMSHLLCLAAVVAASTCLFARPAWLLPHACG